MPWDPSPDCYLCEGLGYIEDDTLCRTYKCPVCDKPRAKFLPYHADGWLRGVKRVEARHYGGPLRLQPDLVVIHRAVSGGDVSAYFRTPSDGRPVSAHFVVEKDGSVVQCVPVTHRAYHAGGVNKRSLGIETQGPMDTEFPEPLILSLHKLIFQLTGIYDGIRTIVGHSYVSPGRRSDPGENFPWARFKDLGLSSPHFSSV